MSETFLKFRNKQSREYLWEHLQRTSDDFGIKNTTHHARICSQLSRITLDKSTGHCSDGFITNTEHV